ncbi:hypothetical protein [Luteimicrobium sp. DT211]|uniref:hypothetical protein n=1 Tax=Luteimicrobium sp. DT211 TaxID=3393412 RepID=UPI003CE91C9D
MGAELKALGELPLNVVLVVPGRSPGPDVTVQCGTRDRHEARVRVLLPRGFAALPKPAQRASVARTLVEAAGTACGPEARDLVSRATDLAADYDFVYRRSSPWKWAPGRRRRARLSGWLADDGFARVVAEVDEGERVRVSAPARGPTTARRLARTLASLRWRGPDQLELVSGGMQIRGFGDAMEVGASRVAFDVRDDRLLAGPDDDDAGTAAPAVAPGGGLRSGPIAVTPLADGALYLELDCGPVEDEPARLYAGLVDLYSDAIRTDPQWMAWFTALGVPRIWLSIELDPAARDGDATAGVAPGGRGAGATLRIAPRALLDEAAFSRQVHDDVLAVIEALRALLDAPLPPGLPGLPPIAAAADPGAQA